MTDPTRRLRTKSFATTLPEVGRDKRRTFPPFPRYRPRRAAFSRPRREIMIGSSVVLQPIIALIAGILILIAPRILNYVVAAYLIFIGIVGLFPALQH
jgi:hypothetical protein